ncbi:MAG: TonB-dependent receptor [Haliscomenobacter sp.]|uniref:TonB-dependent receptor domain-containing protein n=1 Tax=Haliscomenobacter sp. TaxID=2717303 RepID=UPI0029BA8C8D|nr:TonB-dependent receptor [Haliscomenobacter sp.]MDX2068430.1 TonB-dependent receptor [Haliscomenobacter sp.]
MKHPLTKVILAALFILALLQQGFGQNSKQANLKGKIIEAQSKAPLAYAAIRILKNSDSTLVSGGISDEKGLFSLEAPYGDYHAVVEFLGYQPIKIPSFSLSAGKNSLDLGTISLSASAQNLQEVVVQGEKSSMELALDKKIFNVGKDLANAGGTASDILSNIPSVSVDGEGNVKLRGSDNVRILIDGKPSGLVSFKGGAGLQQLQGSLVDKVEVITNPSARYEAEGMSGIINIVLKKDRRQGFNGSFDLIAGNPDNFGAGANVNYRKDKINFFLNYALAYRLQPGRGETYQEVYDGATTRILEQTSKGRMRAANNSINGGLDYYFDDKNIFTASYLWRRSDARRINDNQYKDYINSLSNRFSVTDRQQDETEDEPNSEYALSYKRSFEKKGHELLIDARYLDYWEHSDQTFTQRTVFDDGIINKVASLTQKSLNDETEKQWLFSADYVQPFGKEGKYELGVRSSFRDMSNDFFVTEQDSTGRFQPLDSLNNNFLYDENINAAYAIIGNKIKRFSYQFGLRAEHTDIKTTLAQTNESNPRNYANLFPSAHFTYKLAKENSLQISYSRRVRRPRYNDLSPFVTYSDNRNFFSGNPDLNPEFTDAYDLGHVKFFEKGSFASSLYYRYTTGKIDRIRRVNSDGFAATRPENLLDEHSFGAEFTSSFTLKKWWKLDFNVNFFRAITDGSNIQEDYQSDTYAWFARQTSRFSLPKKTDIQIRASYEAPRQTPQGEVKSLFFTDLSMSRDLFKGKGKLILNVLDVFNSRRFRSITRGENFYTENNSQMRLRQINLTLNYRLNQAQQMTRRRIGGEEE